jgi:crossover junction endodeoxyribonuclease RuvC
MRIMGVDPGSVITGYGVIERSGSTMHRVTSGIVAMRSSEALSLRLERVYATLIDVMDQHHPDEFAIETAFYGKNVQSTLKLGQVRGVAILAAVHRQLGIAEYAPREIKRAITGTGAAAKQQVEFMVQRLLNLRTEFQSSDEADALAVALCHSFRFTAPRVRFDSWEQFIHKHPDRVHS